MRKLLIILGLVLSVVVSGQVITHVSYAYPVVGGEGAPITNMLSNGTFDSGTGWTTGTGWSISNDSARWVTSSSGNLSQTDADMLASLAVSEVYKLDMDITMPNEDQDTATVQYFSADGLTSYSVFLEYAAHLDTTVYFVTPSDIGNSGFAIRMIGSTYTTENVILDNLVLMVSPNHVDNGTFSGITQGASTTGAEWTTEAGWTIGSGVASFDDVTASGVLQTDANMSLSILPSTDYRITYTVSTVGTARIIFKNATETVDYSITQDVTDGNQTLDITTPADVDGGGFMVWASASGSTDPFTITNIEVQRK